MESNQLTDSQIQSLNISPQGSTLTKKVEMEYKRNESCTLSLSIDDCPNISII